MSKPERDDEDASSGGAGDPDVRFSLANERTFLAWGRTSLAIIATGLALARLLPSGSRPGLEIAAGTGLTVAGTLLAIWAFRDYRRVGTAIRRGDAVGRSSLPAVLLVTIILGGLIALILAQG